MNINETRTEWLPKEYRVEVRMHKKNTPGARMEYLTYTCDAYHPEEIEGDVRDTYAETYNIVAIEIAEKTEPQIYIDQNGEVYDDEDIARAEEKAELRYILKCRDEAGIHG